MYLVNGAKEDKHLGTPTTRNSADPTVDISEHTGNPATIIKISDTLSFLDLLDFASQQLRRELDPGCEDDRLRMVQLTALLQDLRAQLNCAALPSRPSREQV